MAKAGTLSDACVSGDSKDIAQAKQDLTNSLAKTIADAKAAAEKESDPVKRQRLNEQIKRLEELANKLANPNLSPEELKKISSEVCIQFPSNSVIANRCLESQVIGALDDLLRTLNDDRKDTLDKSKGKAAAIAAKLREGAVSSYSTFRLRIFEFLTTSSTLLRTIWTSTHFSKMPWT